MTEPALWIIARQTLTEREYEAIEYTFRYGFTITFTADLLNITEGAVRSRIDRAIRRLRQHANDGNDQRSRHAALPLEALRDRSRPRPQSAEGAAGIDGKRRNQTAA